MASQQHLSDEDDPQSQDDVAKRGRSFVWEYFTRIDNKIKCSRCQTKYAKNTGLTNLKRHLFVAHQIDGTKPGVYQNLNLNLNSVPQLFEKDHL